MKSGAFNNSVKQKITKRLLNFHGDIDKAFCIV